MEAAAPARSTAAREGVAACPLCGGALYGWLTLPDAAARPTVGRPVDAAGAVLERCESCGLGVERGLGEIDLEAEAAALVAAGQGELAAPNRASLQAAIGGEGWAAIDARPGRLFLTPQSLRLLCERTGRGGPRVRCRPFGRNQGWMWQTLINGLTFHPNFAREVRAGRLRPATARGPLTFAVDCVVTVLAAPLVLLASVPLELAAALVGRGGELVAEPD
jgi:hypothetical protein